jgi:hypothetical protein
MGKSCYFTCYFTNAQHHHFKWLWHFILQNHCAHYRYLQERPHAQWGGCGCNATPKIPLDPESVLHRRADAKGGLYALCFARYCLLPVHFVGGLVFCVVLGRTLTR